jgi:MFS family permease
LSNLADGVFGVALPLIAIQYTQSPTLIAGLALAGNLPWLVFALQAGAISDRKDRRRVMFSANVLRGLLLLVLAAMVALDAATIWALYVVVFLAGIAETLYDTSAQSILPQVVGRTLLPRANSRLYAAELTANEFVGPPLGGFLVTIGAGLVLAGSGSVWLLAALVLLLLRGSYKTDHDGSTTMRADVAEGLRFLRHHRVLRNMALLTGVGNFAGTAAWSVFVLFAVGSGSAMGLTEPQYGLLMTATAIGAFVGTFIAEFTQRRLGRSRTLILMIVTISASIAAPAFTTNPWIIGAFSAFGGLTIVMGNIVMVSLRQRVTPDRLLGRVNSAYRMLAWGLMPLGALFGGFFTDWFGFEALFAVAGLISLGTLGCMVALSNHAIEQAERDADEPAAN